MQLSDVDCRHSHVVLPPLPSPLCSASRRRTLVRTSMMIREKQKVKDRENSRLSLAPPSPD